MARVLALDWVSDWDFQLTIERAGLDYQAGACTLLIRDDEVDSRPYSLASHPDEDHLRFIVRRLVSNTPQASFSHWLSTRRAGDSIGVGVPFGWFYPGQSNREIWFATGSGIAPFIGALHAQRPNRPQALYYGVRTVSEALYRSFLDARLPVHWAFSQDPSGRARRVTDYLPTVGIADDLQYFVCGNPRMIQDVTAGLVSAGVSPEQIHQEQFFE